MSGTTDVATVNRQMIEAAAQAGASQWFRVLAAIDEEAVEIKRNYVASKLAGVCDDPQNPDPDLIAQRMQQSGDFIGNLWDGDLATALYHADAANMRLIVRTLSDEVLIETLRDDRGSYESAVSWLEPNLDRYGFGGE